MSAVHEVEERIRVEVRRQDSPAERPYCQVFEVGNVRGMNIISVLQAIRRNPVTVDGRKVAPVVWECNCLEEVCGACTMVINGRVRQACSTLVHHLKERPIRLEAMTKFPIIRDLMVDRSFMFANLKRVKAWVPVDGYYDLGPGQRFVEKERLASYWFSRCMTCGCCLEACPQFLAIEGDPEKDAPKFMGAQIAGQVRLFNALPTGKVLADDRLDELMGAGGIAACGNAQNCVEVCPKEIPLTDALADLNWAVNARAVKQALGIGPQSHKKVAEPTG